MTIDDFRKDEALFEDEQAGAAAPAGRPRPRRRRGPFLGITPAQRFALATMLFAMTCLLGTFFLILTERIFPPGLY